MPDRVYRLRIFGHKVVGYAASFRRAACQFCRESLGLTKLLGQRLEGRGEPQGGEDRRAQLEGQRAHVAEGLGQLLARRIEVLPRVGVEPGRGDRIEFPPDQGQIPN